MADNYQINIKSNINGSEFMEPDDVMQTKRALKALGYYPVEGGVGSPYPDGPMFEAIGRFQIDHGLRADRRLGPGGATQAAINHCLADGLAHGVNPLPHTAETRAGATPAQAPLGAPGRRPSPGRKAADEARHEMCEYRSLA